jgi:DNA-binding LacI/PurR family transcriptional regulator
MSKAAQLSEHTSAPREVVERPTIQAVAARAGVSPTTASLVLAGKSGSRRIAEATQDRVMQAAEELNYAPNLGTRSIRGQRTHILSFFNTFRNRDREDLYMNALSSAIEAAGGAMGYDILVHCNYERDARQTFQSLNGGLADGLLLLAPRRDDPLLEHLRKSRLPAVFINTDDEENQYSSVYDDVEEGMRLVANALLSAGHRRVGAVIDPDPNIPDCQERMALLRRFLGDAGVELTTDRIGAATERTIEAVLPVLTQGPDAPTAVFCWHDRIAYRLVSSLESAGISVPSDLAVIGYDGLHWPSRSPHIVSSVRVDLNELACEAVKLLIERIEDPASKPVRRQIPVTFLHGSTLASS